MNSSIDEKIIKGVIYGFAFGDAWGKDTEFRSYEELASLPYIPYPSPALVTDDTQMSLYAMQAVMDEMNSREDSLTGLHLDEKKRNLMRVAFADAFVEFARDPDNNRAPGMTCMKALGYYMQARDKIARHELTGMEGVIAESKGCGANMRSGWLGLLPLEEKDIINLAILQSETTHGHPLALSSSVITALAVKAIASGEIHPGKGTYYRWALNKTSYLQHEAEKENAAGGWNPDYASGLAKLFYFLMGKREEVAAYATSDYMEDICSFFGEGWVAEEAFLCGLVGADYNSAPLENLERMVRTNGDSDSIAAIGGQYIGANTGLDIFPPHFEERLEDRYKEELEEVIDFLIQAH